jgi:predicted Fe-S protein YdhL (DUF1289 family)
MYITPCVSLCQVDKETSKCKGCNRTLDQIRNWSSYTDEERMEVMKELGYGKRTSTQNRMAREAARINRRRSETDRRG